MTADRDGRVTRSGRSNREIRFAIGSPERPRSSVWKLWGSKNDVYLAARTTGGIAKLSLHASGIWRYAYTAESGVVAPSGDRCEARWTRPTEFVPGWTVGPRLDFPVVATWYPPAGQAEPGESRVRWVTADPGMKVTATVFFTSRDPASGQLTGNGTPVAPEDLLGPVVLKDRSTVVVAIRRELMSEAELAHYEHIVSDITIHGGSPLLGASLLEVNREQPILLELAVGRHISASERGNEETEARTGA